MASLGVTITFRLHKNKFWKSYLKCSSCYWYCQLSSALELLAAATQLRVKRYNWLSILTEKGESIQDSCLWENILWNITGAALIHQYWNLFIQIIYYQKYICWCYDQLQVQFVSLSGVSGLGTTSISAHQKLINWIIGPSLPTTPAWLIISSVLCSISPPEEVSCPLLLSTSAAGVLSVQLLLSECFLIGQLNLMLTTDSPYKILLFNVIYFIRQFTLWLMFWSHPSY